MKNLFTFFTICITLMFFTNSFSKDIKSNTNPSASGNAKSQWVYYGKDGKLEYKTTPSGDKIMDYSYAGYMGGGVALPDVPAKITLKPIPDKDNSGLIQKAIDSVAKMPLENGFRGAVLLSPGTFICSKTIHITSSGVVLRGSGSGKGGTTIWMNGKRHIAFMIGVDKYRKTAMSLNSEIAAEQESSAKANESQFQTTIADSYVPFGADTFWVVSAKGFQAGDVIEIKRPTTPAWVHFMVMDNLYRDGKHQTWISQKRYGIEERKITAVNGNKITINVPLSDSYNSEYLNPPGTIVAAVEPNKQVSNTGLEHFHIQCSPLEIDYGHAPYSAARIGGNDCWINDIYAEEIMNTFVLTGKRITVRNVIVKHTYPNLGASKPTDFSIEGSQILIDRCKVTGDNEYFVWTGSLVAGPNVILNSTFNGHGSRIQPHQRWATGLLVDNCKVPDGGIDFMNRGSAGSGHGWTMGWAVAWNCLAKTYVIQNPPGAMNWAIGCIGKREQTARLFDTSPILPEGVYDSYEIPVTPQSLYLAQLQERLGEQALHNIGYSSNSKNELTDKTLHTLPPLSKDIDKELGEDLALHRPINTSNVRGTTRKFDGEKAVDGNPNTYWATDDSVTTANLIADTEGPLDINAVLIEEPDGIHHVEKYKVEGFVNSAWKLLSQGTTIGSRKVDKFPKETVWKVRLTVQKGSGYIAIKKFGFYLEK
jgi:F5/8 type C domain